MEDLRYADTAMISKSRSDLSEETCDLTKCKEYGLQMNASKTNVMALSREDGRNAENFWQGQDIEQSSEI